MPTLDEILDEPLSTPIHDALAAGVDVLGQSQTVDFVPYVLTVLPVDGFVFWVRASLLPPEKLAEQGLQSADPITVSGSLHYSSVGTMMEDENITIQHVDFTALTPVTEFAQISPKVLYVAQWDTPLGSFKFTFSQRGTYYRQADVHHYVGDAVYPAFELQLIDSIEGFNQRQVVSNSMPMWLALRERVPFVSLVTSAVELYPAYIIPSNLRPPYGTVLINPSSTRALQAVAYRDRMSSRWQLVTETARLTFYGLRNEEVMDFVDYVVDYSVNVGGFGIMNMPVVRDEHRVQVELSALAQKKTVDFEVSYNQHSMREVARRLIEDAFITVVPSTQLLAAPPLRSVVPFMSPFDPLEALGATSSASPNQLVWDDGSALWWDEDTRITGL